MAVNVQKLLPSSKGSPLAKISAINVSSSIAIKKKAIDTAKLMKPVKEESEPGSIQKTLYNIDSSLKLLLREEQKQQSTKKKQKEKENFEKEEKKLEAPKESKKFKMSGLTTPGMGFLDRIKRFLFFTALGWLFTKFQDQLPKLEGVVKVITRVYGVAENIFKFLLESFVNFIDRGYKTYDKVRELVKGIGGEKAERDFDNLSGKLNEYINYALIGGMALTGAINAFNKASGRATGKLAEEATKKTTGEIAKKATKGVLEKTAQASRIGAVKASQAVVGKQATRQLLRLAKGPLARLPILGGLIEFGLSWALGDPVGKAAFRGIGTVLLGAVGSVILGPGFGTFVGGWAGAELAGKLYELLFENKQPKGALQKKRDGGSITRGGKSQGGSPSRTIKIVRRKPPKIKPKQSQPGKDVGGKKKIKSLYPDPSAKTEIEGDQKSPWFNLLPPLPNGASAKQIQDRNDKIKKLPNPYNALTGVAKKLKDIPFGIGALMGGAVDIALGEKLQPNAIQSLSNGISYLIGAVANQQISSSIRDIEKEIAKMQTGGNVPRPRIKDFTKRDDIEFGKDINKVLSGLIQNKVDEAIREVQKQLLPMKYSEGGLSGGFGGGYGGGGGGGGGQLPPTGKNGRYSRSELTYVGKMNPAEVKVKFENDWYGRDIYLRSDAAAAFKAAQKEAGPKVGWVLNTGYRSLEHQQALIDAGYPAAPVGYSNHGDGVALDIQSGTNGHSWLIRNGKKFGWRWPNIPGDEVHFYYDGSYTPKGQKKSIPDLFKQDSKQKPGEISPIFNRPGADKPVKKTGKASWYGPGFQGNRTASGQVFDTNKLTAASPTLPFGTKVTVTNKANGKSVVVTINDRGPYESDLVTPHKTRVIDLSKAAMDKLGGLGSGIIDVDLSYQGGGYIPKQPPRRNTTSLSRYPSYSSEGGMMIAIQPVIVEKPIPMPSSGGKGRSITFIGGGSVNNTMQGLSRG